MQEKSVFFHKNAFFLPENLRMSKKCSTFARFFRESPSPLRARVRRTTSGISLNWGPRQLLVSNANDS